MCLESAKQLEPIHAWRMQCMWDKAFIRLFGTHWQCWEDSRPTPLTNNSAEQRRENKSTSSSNSSLSSCGNFVLLLLDYQRLPKSGRCRQVGMFHGQEKWSQLLVIDYVCCVRSLSLRFRLRCMCRTRSKSWLNGYVFCFYWTSVLLIGLVISWSSSKGTMGESSQTSGVSRDRKLWLVLSTRFCTVATYLDNLFLLAAFDFLQWPRSLMVFSSYLPDLDMVEEIVSVLLTYQFWRKVE